MYANMININTSDKLLSTQFKNFSLEDPISNSLSLLPPIFTDLYQNNEKNQEILSPVLEGLQDVLKKLQFDIGRGNCPNCNKNSDLSQFKKKNINQRKILIIGGNELEIKITNYYCSVCKHINREHHNLTLHKGLYDRHIVLTAVRYYTCGMSYRLIQANLFQEFQIYPSISTILYWIQHVGSIAHELNREVLIDLKDIDITWDEFFLAIRDGQMEGEHSSVFSTLFMELNEGAFLLGGVNIGKQTNILTVKSYLKAIKSHEPQNGVADGCLSYPRATAEELPDMRFINDPVHKARSARKKKRTKQIINTHKKEFKKQISDEWRKQIAEDAELFQKELKSLSRQHPGNVDAGNIIKRAQEDWKYEEQNEIKALEELTKNETQYFEHTLQRRIYVGQEAAQLAKSKMDDQDPLEKPLTSSKIEGWNRVHRSRERKMLCYRSLQSFYSIIGLLGLLHNMVGVGRGCIYSRLGLSIPSSPWNPFLNFPPIIKTENELSVNKDTPFRQRETKFRQQHSTLLIKPESFRSPDVSKFNNL